MDQIPYPGVGYLFKLRFITLFFLLSAVDAIMLATAVESIAVHGVGAVVLFGNEVSCFWYFLSQLKYV